MMQGVMTGLKGQCHEIFDFMFFHKSVSSKPLSIPLKAFRIFENSRRYSQLNVHHRLRWQMEKIFNQKSFHYLLISVVASWFANKSANFRKLRSDPNVIFRGFGEDNSWKKPGTKNLVTLSLFVGRHEYRTLYLVLTLLYNIQMQGKHWLPRSEESRLCAITNPKMSHVNHINLSDCTFKENTRKKEILKVNLV
jgi:hypothetical protein